MITHSDLPKVSVIIPVYNGCNYLSEAVESVFAQTYPHVELLVVDDGSTDSTWDLIQSYGTRLRGIRKENGGVASALNCGIMHATGDYIAWLSHDDLFLPMKLKRQIEYLRQHPQFKSCYTDYYTIDETGIVIREIQTPWYPRQQAIRILFGKVYINGSTMVIQKDCFDEVGLFSEKLRYTQDTEMWLRLLRRFEIGRVPETLGKWRTHSHQGSVGLEKHREETQRMYQEVFDDWGISTLYPDWKRSAENKEIKAKAYNWFGDIMSFQRGLYAFAEQQYTRSLYVYPSWQNPARIKRIINLILSVIRPLYRGVKKGWKGNAWPFLFRHAGRVC